MELICPAFVISILVYLKSTSRDYTVELGLTQAIASPIYPGLLYVTDPSDSSDFGNGAWEDEKQEDDSLAADMQAFLSYVGYEPLFKLELE